MERHACRRRLPYAALQSGTIGCRDGDSGDGLFGGSRWTFARLFGQGRQYRVPAKGGSIDGPGPAIAGGILVVNSGYAYFNGIPGNVLLAFGVD